MFVFQSGRTSSTFTIEHDVKNQLFRILSKDIQKDLGKDGWMYLQICTSNSLSIFS